MQPVIRLVLDSNVLLSALLFRNGALSDLRTAWKNSQINPLVCQTTISELLRVLAYPKFGLDEAAIEALLADYLPYAEVVKLPETPCDDLPLCRDAHDQKFLQLAHAGRADFLVTGDKDLLALRAQIMDNAKLQFVVCSPAELLNAIF